MKRKIKLGALALLGALLVGTATLFGPYYLLLTRTLHVSVIKTLLSLDSLKTFNNQVNILILGVAGGNRPGDSPNLSDTIIVANYNFKTNRLTTISVPRDIWSETLKDKINSAYSYGSFSLAKSELKTVIGMPIQYATVIDFEKFKEFIDFLGGVDISVETSFDDYAYPIAGREDDSCGHSQNDITSFTATAPAEMQIWTYFPCRYEHVRFERGSQHMDGQTALKFVRSRHAQGDEGTDFAREKRQQKVIEAIKNSMLTFLKKKEFNKLEQLYGLLNNIVIRDITNQQVAIIAKNIILKRGFKQKQVTLTEDFFNVPEYSTFYDGKWVLVPKSGDFKIIHQYINCILLLKNCEELKNK